LVSLIVQGWTINPLARRLGLVVPARIGPVDKVELELPGTALHELLAYRVVPDSPVATGERIPRWARPSLVIRDGKSMRYQYAGRLQAGDYVYLFISSRYPRLLDRLFASPLPVQSDDAEFFGEFSIDPQRPAKDLHAAYDIGLVKDELDLSIDALLTKRLGGKAEFGDRVVLKNVEIIVRDVDDQGRITSAGLSLDPDSNRPNIPVFLSAREIAALLRQRVKRRQPPAKTPLGPPPSSLTPATDTTDDQQPQSTSSEKHTASD
jgi:cell volume regulation protein A